MAQGNKTKSRKTTETQRRMQILHAALRCGAKKGLAGMTMDDVSQVARLSKGLPFYYFKSKQKLHLAMIDLFSHDVSDRSSSIQQSDASEETILRSLAQAFVSALTIDCKHPTMLIEFWTLGLRDRQIAARLQQARELMQSQILAILERGKASGAFNCKDAALAVRSLYCTLMGIASQWVLGGQASDPIQTTKAALDMFMCSVRNPSAARSEK